MNTQKRFEIYQEEAKLRQIGHWDLDYLPAAEVERLMRAEAKPVCGPHSPPANTAFRLGLIAIVSLTTAAVTGITYLLIV